MFLEERIDQKFSFGSAWSEVFAAEAVTTEGGDEYTRLRHPYPQLMIDLDFMNRTEAYLFDEILDLYRRSGGIFGGFRWYFPSEFSTNGNKGAPTYDDQACVLSSAGIYQITKWYNTEGVSTSTRRRIRKPVAGTVLVGIRDDFDNPVQVVATGVSPERWTVDTTTGLVTFKANRSKVITGITQAAQAVVTVGSAHGYVANDSVHFSGVAGMTEINGLRATVQSVAATTITVNIDSQAFSAFSVASPLGQVNTRPQANETVTAGCQFDIPVRFETDLSSVGYAAKNSSDIVMSTGVRLVEKLNP